MLSGTAADSPRVENNAYRDILSAIKAGRVAEVQDFLTKECVKGDPRNLSLFSACVHAEQCELVRCCLQNGVVPPNESPLFAALRKVKILEVVLAEGYSVHVTTPFYKTLLQRAIVINQAALPILINAGCDVTARDVVHGNTALHTACTHYAGDCVLQLIQAGAWLNVENSQGDTPLHCLLKPACGGPQRQDFHAKSRQKLARSLMDVGMTLSVTSNSSRPRSQGQAKGSADYKVIQLYQQLRKQTLTSGVWPLQHLCRVRLRQLLEERVRNEDEELLEEGGEQGEGGEERKEGDEAEGFEPDSQKRVLRRVRNAKEVVQELELSPFMRDYLLFKDHVF